MSSPFCHTTYRQITYVCSSQLEEGRAGRWYETNQNYYKVVKEDLHDSHSIPKLTSECGRREILRIKVKTFPLSCVDKQQHTSLLNHAKRKLFCLRFASNSNKTHDVFKLVIEPTFNCNLPRNTQRVEVKLLEWKISKSLWMSSLSLSCYNYIEYMCAYTLVRWRQ